MRLYRVAVALIAAVSVPSVAPVRSATATAPPSRWVSVSVATLWAHPRLARPIDKPAVSNPADPRTWVSSMTVNQKRWLVGRLETQALYGTRVYLLGTSGAWSKVAVPSQPSPRSSWGYPGWVASAQLGVAPPAVSTRIAVVRRRTAWLWTSPASIGSSTGRVMEISYDTRLPIVVVTSSYVEVVMLDGRHRFLLRTVVALHDVGAPWAPFTRTRVVTEARRFLGLQYLWAGTSGFGFDCSGLTHSVYHALGVTIPRDADAQYARGAKIALRSGLRWGDLVFFRNPSGVIHHVGLYVGDGRMIHAPATGQAVQITSIYRYPYYGEFAGGRRYV